MPTINNGSFYNTAGTSRSGNNSKQLIFLGIGIVIVIGATFMTYRYFTQGVGGSAPVVKTEEAPGVKPVGSADAETLPQEAIDVRNAVKIYTAIANISLDTEFFNSNKFKELTGGEVKIPDASPGRGRVFELWQKTEAGSQQTVTTPPPPPSAGGIRIRR